jgi:hypothetical protein
MNIGRKIDFGERGHHLHCGDREILAHARPLQEIAERCERVGGGGEQARIDSAGPRQDFPYRKQRHHDGDPRRNYANACSHRACLRIWSEPA